MVLIKIIPTLGSTTKFWPKPTPGWVRAKVAWFLRSITRWRCLPSLHNNKSFDWSDASLTLSLSFRKKAFHSFWRDAIKITVRILGFKNPFQSCKSFYNIKRVEFTSFFFRFRDKFRFLIKYSEKIFLRKTLQAKKANFSFFLVRIKNCLAKEQFLTL